MSDNVVALPGFSLPSQKPVAQVVEFLEEALAKARAGKTVGIGIITCDRDPDTFVTYFVAEQGSRYSLAAGILSLHHDVGELLAKQNQ